MPGAGIGVAVVLNRGNMLAFAEAVRNGVLEVAFDQPPAGDAGVAFAVEQQRAFVAGVAETIVPLDEVAVEPFLGTWSHPLLGEVALMLDGERLIADAGEIASELAAAHDAATGERFYVTVTPPFVGLRVSLQDEGGRRSLVIYDPGSAEVYAFEQMSGTSATQTT